MRGGNDVALTVRVAPLLEQLRMDADALEAAVAECWKSIERLQEPGAHASFVPPEVRRRQVTDRLLASGVALATAKYRELKFFEGPAGEVLRHFAGS